MKCSVCIATVPQKAETFRRVLESIFVQTPGFEFEVIVAHDGHPEVVDPRTVNLIVRTGGEYRDPCVARNAAMRRAKGDVLVLQSDDVIHNETTVLRRLVDELEPGTFQLARVLNSDGKHYVSQSRRRPFFFLGSVLRAHVFAVGGNCEEFIEPGYDDTWFAACLMNGLRLRPVYRKHVSGTHIDHPRPDLTEARRRMKAIYLRKMTEAQSDPAKWVGGPSWDF